MTNTTSEGPERRPRSERSETLMRGLLRALIETRESEHTMTQENLDPKSTPMSCDHPRAIALYEKALREYQSYVGDAVATIDQALLEQPDFVMGHVFKAGVLMTFGEKRFREQAAASVAAAEALLSRANDRERGLISATRKLVDGDWHAACVAFDQVLVDTPHDAFAIQTAHLFDFYRGDALNLRNRISRVLPRWSPSVPGYSYVLGMHAFGLEECNQYAEAEDTARRALSIEPRDGWAIHAAVHCMEMQGRVDQGIELLETRHDDWAPENGFAFHNYWHLGLFYLDRGQDRKVLELYDTGVMPQPSDLSLQLVDATAMLWRLRLLGVPVEERFEQLASAWESKLDAERGFYAFNDVHAMMAFAATGREAAATRLLKDLDGGFGAEVGFPIAYAFLAFERGRYEESIELLQRVRDTAHRFGGSHAQRDVLTLTLLAAARRAGRHSLVRHLLGERRTHKPASELGTRLLARVE